MISDIVKLLEFGVTIASGDAALSISSIADFMKANFSGTHFTACQNPRHKTPTMRSLLPLQPATHLRARPTIPLQKPFDGAPVLACQWTI